MQVLAGVLRQPGGAELLRQELLRSSSSSSALQALQAQAQALSHSGGVPSACPPICPGLRCSVPCQGSTHLFDRPAVLAEKADSDKLHPDALPLRSEHAMLRPTF